MKLHRVLAAGVLFASASLSAASPVSIAAEVHDDGSVIIEGVRYTDVTPLRIALGKLKQRHVTIHIWGKPTVNFEGVGKAILLLQKAGCADGCMKIGFITGPASSH